MKLYETTEILCAIDKELEESGGEIDEALEFRLDQVLHIRALKVNSIVRHIKNDESYIAAIASEIKRLQELKKHYDSKCQRWKDYLAREVQPDEEFKSEVAIVKWQKCPPSVEVDESKIAKKWCEKIYRPIKNKIKLRLQAGEKIKGARLITDKKTLRIR